MAHVIDFKEAGFDSVLDELEWRGLISQSTDRDRLAEALNGEPITYYCGFDLFFRPISITMRKRDGSMC